jgi:putative glycerol-1-phosphate prenyltransferase
MNHYHNKSANIRKDEKLLAILLDPDKFPFSTLGTTMEIDIAFAKAYLKKIPQQTTHLLIGGSTDAYGKTNDVVRTLKSLTNLPIILFPGDHTQVSPAADGILFLSLLSGRNPDYLIGQQVQVALTLKEMELEIIPTGYLLIDGQTETAVQRISGTTPMPQEDVQNIVATALAGQFLGKKMIYLEAGSGAKVPVNPAIIKAVKAVLDIPLIVGGGIKSAVQQQTAYQAGADMVVIGTAFEEDCWSH